MNDVLPFVPKASIKRKKALDKLVQHYKKVMNKPLRNPIDPLKDEWIWGHWRWQAAGRFMKLEHIHELGNTAKECPKNMQLPASTFEQLQAITLHNVLNGRSKAYIQRLIYALLAIEMVLRERSIDGIADFTTIKASDLENAVDRSMSVGERNSPLAIDYARDAFVELNIVTAGTVKTWVNALAKQQNSERHRATKGSATVNDNKLPNMEAVVAAAEYFANLPWVTRGEELSGLESSKDLIVSSVLAIISQAPTRYGEVINNLPVNGLVRQPVKSVGEVLGLHWYADKTDMNHTKWVPFTYSGIFEVVVEEAIARIKWVSEDARNLLRSWDSKCPEFSPKAYATAKENGYLPKNWPWRVEKLKLRYSDSLFVSLKYQFDDKKNTIEDQVELITPYKFRDWLNRKNSKNVWTGEPYVKPGFFDRIGYSGCKTACKTFQGPGEKSVEKFPPQVVQ